MVSRSGDYLSIYSMNLGYNYRFVYSCQLKQHRENLLKFDLLSIWPGLFDRHPISKFAKNVALAVDISMIQLKVHREKSKFLI
jgi:hypothetical protein